jgi:hypothetical protein
MESDGKVIKNRENMVQFYVAKMTKKYIPTNLHNTDNSKGDL